MAEKEIMHAGYLSVSLHEHYAEEGLGKGSWLMSSQFYSGAVAQSAEGEEKEYWTCMQKIHNADQQLREKHS